MKVFNNPNLIVFTGPSGVGKGTLLNILFANKDLNLAYSISATTRPKRDGEKDGVDYFFLTEEQFKEKIEAKEFLEWAIYAGNYYGTLKNNVEELIKKGKKVILEIEVQGALEVMNLCPEATTIFIAPENIEELRRRLLERKTESEDIINKRLEIAKYELKQSEYFKFNIKNIDLNKATTELEFIFKKISQKDDNINNMDMDS